MVVLHLMRIAEVRCDDEVKIALERMPENDRLIVAEFDEQALQVGGAGRQSRHGERDVLDHDGRTYLTYRPDRREQALADLPQLLVLGRHLGE